MRLGSRIGALSAWETRDVGPIALQSTAELTVQGSQTAVHRDPSWARPPGATALLQSLLWRSSREIGTGTARKEGSKKKGNPVRGSAPIPW